MAYCYEQGIPHSVFLSWDEEDRAKILAYLIEKSLRCPSCGTAEWEWEEDPFAYEATRITCFGCQQKELLSDDDMPSPAGSSVTLLPAATARRLAEHAHKKPPRRPVSADG